jgi:thiol-disulfide isomerase/thioredoxin
MVVSLTAFCQKGQDDICDSPLITLKNRTLTKDSLSGKVIVINFWFMACGPCQKEIPDLQKLRSKYKGNQEVEFIAISSIDEFDQIRYFISRKPFDYEHVSKNKEWIEFYEVNLFPTNIIIDKSGKMAFRKEGYWSDIFTELDKEIQKCL